MWESARIWYHYQTSRIKRWYQNSFHLGIHQQMKIQTLLEHIYAHIEFYQEFQGIPFERLPVMNKSLMQENFSVLNTYRLSAEQLKEHRANHPALQIRQSAGTSGTPGTYLYSAKELIIALGDVLSKILPEGLGSQKLALFHLSKTPYFPEYAPFRHQWCFLDLNQDFDELLGKLQAFAPTVLIAPVQTLSLLAMLQQAEKINLRPKKIITTAEVLTPIEENNISSAFQQNIHQLYQCAEGWLGVSCDYGTLHLNENLYHIEKEWVDKSQGRFIPVVTALTNFVQPIVRYQMEDILIEKTNCPCGSPLLGVEKIVGRCEDILYFSERNALKPIYSDNIYQTLHQADGGIHQYQIFQDSPHHLLVKMHAENPSLARQCAKQQLEKLWSLHGVAHPTLEFAVLGARPLNQMFRQTKRLAKISVF